MISKLLFVLCLCASTLAIAAKAPDSSEQRVTVVTEWRSNYGGSGQLYSDCLSKSDRAELSINMRGCEVTNVSGCYVESGIDSELLRYSATIYYTCN